MHNDSHIKVSLEPHLEQSLRVIRPLLPLELSQQLDQYLENAPLIPYQTISQVSQWTRSTAGQKTLEAHSLDFHAYSMISLLAGVTTSPDRKFGDYTPLKEPDQIAADLQSERKAITALVNALLSVVGVGFAAWWASDMTGWKHEWRVLFALFVSIVVAASEAGLYLIWSSRRSKRKLVKRSTRHKKIDPIPDVVDSDNKRITDSKEGSLRHRR